MGTIQTYNKSKVDSLLSGKADFKDSLTNQTRNGIYGTVADSGALRVAYCTFTAAESPTGNGSSYGVEVYRASSKYGRMFAFHEGNNAIYTCSWVNSTNPSAWVKLEESPVVTPINITALDTTRFTLGANRSCKLDYPTHTTYSYYFTLTSVQVVAGSTVKYISLGDIVQADVAAPIGHIPLTVSCNNGTYPAIACEAIATDLKNMRLFIPSGLNAGSLISFSGNLTFKK